MHFFVPSALFIFFFILSWTVFKIKSLNKNIVYLFHALFFLVEQSVWIIWDVLCLRLNLNVCLCGYSSHDLHASLIWIFSRGFHSFSLYFWWYPGLNVHNNLTTAYLFIWTLDLSLSKQKWDLSKGEKELTSRCWSYNLHRYSLKNHDILGCDLIKGLFF